MGRSFLRIERWGRVVDWKSDLQGIAGVRVGALPICRSNFSPTRSVIWRCCWNEFDEQGMGRLALAGGFGCRFPLGAGPVCVDVPRQLSD